MRNKAPYDLWIIQMKDVLELKGIEYSLAVEVYDFHRAWGEFDMTPEAAVVDLADVLEEAEG